MRLLLVLFLLLSYVNATSLSEARYIHKTKGAYSAIPLYKELADDGNIDAMISLAKIFIKGEMVATDLKRAFKILQKASKLNSAKADYLLGKIYQSKRSPYYDQVQAYNYFVDSANAGYAKAQETVGKYFLFGKIVDKDYEKAIYYFKEASKQRVYSANCYIAFMYANGYGVFPNFGRAHVFAKEQYKKGNKFCIKVWDDFNLERYPEDKGWAVGDYLKPIK